MELEIFQVDAFCNEIFSGNPAAVCPLDNWLKDSLMQNIALENNLAATAFFVKEGNHFNIRWFTPSVEVDLCGHATLAAAHVLFNHKNYEGEIIRFISPRSGELTVRRIYAELALDLPADVFKPVKIREEMYSWFDHKPIEAYRGKTDYLLVFPSEDVIASIEPNMEVLKKLTQVRGVIVTAKGDLVDFVSRFFAPQSGIAEDPVTGSAHTTLTAYWSSRLNKKEMSAMQLSARKGWLRCKVVGDKIEISGKAKTFLTGKLFL